MCRGVEREETREFGTQERGEIKGTSRAPVNRWTGCVTSVGRGRRDLARAAPCCRCHLAVGSPTLPCPCSALFLPCPNLPSPLARCRESTCPTFSGCIKCCFRRSAVTPGVSFASLHACFGLRKLHATQLSHLSFGQHGASRQQLSARNGRGRFGEAARRQPRVVLAGMCSIDFGCSIDLGRFPPVSCRAARFSLLLARLLSGRLAAPTRKLSNDLVVQCLG